MNKILILGDIHGRTCWRDIIDLEKPDKTIFLGDYVSTHDNISPKQQIDNLKDILNYKIENSDSTILLRGNHDLQHFNLNEGNWYCSSYFPEVGKEISKFSDKYYNLTQWVYVLNDEIVFSHAGITSTWFKDTGLSDIEEINSLDINEDLFGFRPGPDNYFDVDGSSVYQGCTWVRPSALVSDPIDYYVQVVGHTTVYNIVDISKFAPTEISSIWLCDNLPQEYLIYEDGEFKKRSYDIELENIDGLNLHLLRQDGGYLTLMNRDRVYTSNVRIIGDINDIVAIDPSGGPYLEVGGKPKLMTTTTIKKIKYEDNIFKIILDE